MKHQYNCGVLSELENLLRHEDSLFLLGMNVLILLNSKREKVCVYGYTYLKFRVMHHVSFSSYMIMVTGLGRNWILMSLST